MWRLASSTGAVLRLLRTTTHLPPAGKPQSTELSTHLVQRVFDEELSSQAEKNRVQVAEIVRQFQCRPGDTGSTPVQIAVLTFKIRHLTEHVKKHRKDYSCQRSLVKMVHQRRKLLQYLERTDHMAYQQITAQLQIRTARPQAYSRT